MGINNFCKLLDLVRKPISTLQPFDSVLIDAQGFLYKAIHYAFELTNQKAFIDEVCCGTYNQILQLLRRVFDSPTDDISKTLVVISFDGCGVPMKWPTQRKRRTGQQFRGKSFYTISLFGANKISTLVYEFVAKKLENLNYKCAFHINGCNIPGEGEHKMFHVADRYKCKNPLVVSVDQDVFIIVLSRIKRFESVQVFRYNQTYQFSKESLENDTYPWFEFEIISFLFGNDFVPPIVAISDANGPEIHTALLKSMEEISNGEDPAAVVAEFLNNLSSVRYETLNSVDPDLLVKFWKTFLWLQDYYRKETFSQMYMTNEIFDNFNRDALLTGLKSKEFSRQAYNQAIEKYESIVTENPKDHITPVFEDPELREKLQRDWLYGESKDRKCIVIRKRKRLDAFQKYSKVPCEKYQMPKKKLLNLKM